MSTLPLPWPRGCDALVRTIRSPASSTRRLIPQSEGSRTSKAGFSERLNPEIS